MKKIILILVLAIITAGSVFAASFDIDENKDIELAGIKKIVFDLKHPNCALCISTGRQFYSINGGGSNGILGLSLEGDMNSNNKKAVPSLYVDETGSTLTVSLYKDRNLYFGLVQSGSAYFTAVLPDYFDGEIEIISSSGDTSVSDINARIVNVESSSGDVAAALVEAEKISLHVSSGEITAEDLSAVKDITISSSSGDVDINNLLSENAEVKVSSGRIVINRMRTTEELTIHANSGRITAEYIEGGAVSLDADSGSLFVKKLKARESSVEASSGDIAVSELDSGNAYFTASSGKIAIDVEKLSGDIDVKSSSGNVNITIPEGTGFDADFGASSGKIKSTFKLLGEVNGSNKNEITGTANGGGHRIRIKASSGDITIEDK